MFSKAVESYFHKTKAYNSKHLYDMFSTALDPVINELEIEDIELKDGYESRDDAEWTDIHLIVQKHCVTFSEPRFDSKIKDAWIYGVIYDLGYTWKDILYGGEFDIFDTYEPPKRIAEGKIYSNNIVEWLRSNISQ